MSHSPFSGVTIVDFSRVLAGPYATAMFADLGAEVIKIEIPGVGDDARHLGPFKDGESVYFSGLNRGKKSVEIDLKSDEDRARLDTLLERADVVVENFRPGVAQKLGISAEQLRAKRPELVYASISGYGQAGSFAKSPAYDTVVQARSGLMSATGTAESGPTRVGESIADVAAGNLAAFGIAAALYKQKVTGEGSHVDIPMYDVLVSMQPTNVAVYDSTGEAPVPSGNAHPVTAPFDTYQVSDGLIVIAVANDRLFAHLAETLERPELATDERFLTDPKRKANEEELRTEIEAALSSHTVDSALELLGSNGIPCSAVLDLKQSLESDLGRERGLIRTDERTGHRYAGHPLLFDGERPAAELPVPRLGEHNDEI